MKILVVHCAAGADHQVTLEVPAGTTVEAAVRLSGLVEGAGAPPLRVGIWNRTVPLDQLVKEGDRIEFYRPLTVDPKEGRRLRAELRRRTSPVRKT
ncbi:MAG: RnfH family protein [Burkholderiaceae bacterium]